MWNMAGIQTVQCGESSSSCGSGNMAVVGMETGSWIGLKGVDFGKNGATQFAASVSGSTEAESAIEIRIDGLSGDVIGSLAIPKESGKESGFKEHICSLRTIVTGVHDVYFIFYGSGYSWDTWQFR